MTERKNSVKVQLYLNKVLISDSSNQITALDRTAEKKHCVKTREFIHSKKWRKRKDQAFVLKSIQVVILFFHGCDINIVDGKLKQITTHYYSYFYFGRDPSCFRFSIHETNMRCARHRAHASSLDALIFWHIVWAEDETVPQASCNQHAS